MATTPETTAIPIARPLIGSEERAAVLRVLDSGQLAQGPEVAAFEHEFAAFLGVRHAVAVANGTAALHVALLAHGIGPGDEVITTPFTFVASANAILYVGARPVFVDIDPKSYNLDPTLVERALTSRTRALLPVYLYGNPWGADAYAEIAARDGLALVEDACQAHGALRQGRIVGTFGTACFSFYPTKNMTTAEGGMIVTNDDAVADRARVLRQHGARHTYEHEVLGYNYRMTEIQAAIGRVQLGRLAEWTARRRANARYYDVHLRSVATPVEDAGDRHVYHQYTVRVPEALGRDALRARLRAGGIGTSVHYPRPVHQQPLYRGLGYADRLPVAEQASREVLSLPVWPGLAEGDLARIVAVLEDA
ncbi:MAG: DegT/DnrJ/EryC1/StrS aminotransferase family protein [Chloroflexi bacterium]|nr:DegT/DnrJ/EryC1/StrS aminotransferase family protein [Chloroflexota bacterium]